MVRKKQIRMSRAIMTTKMKLDRVSKPSQLAKISSGPGKMAIMMKMSGSESQAMEWRMDMRFLVRLKMIRISRMIAAIEISICRFDMARPPYSDS